MSYLLKLNYAQQQYKSYIWNPVWFFLISLKLLLVIKFLFETDAFIKVPILNDDW